MYVLYWNPISSSLAPMAVLEEIGAPYEAVYVDLAKGEHRTAAYREIHPYGRVRLLKTRRPFIKRNNRILSCLLL